MFESQYVKEIGKGKWEVKLGAGMVAFVIEQNELDFFDSLPAFGTFGFPQFWNGQRVTADDFNRIAQGVGAVREFLDKHA